MWCDVCPSRQAICSWSLEEVAKAHLLDYEWKPHWVGEAESPTEKRIEEAELQENNLLQGKFTFRTVYDSYSCFFLFVFPHLCNYLNLSRLLQHVCKNWGSTGSMWWVPFQLWGQTGEEFRCWVKFPHGSQPPGHSTIPASPTRKPTMLLHGITGNPLKRMSCPTSLQKGDFFVPNCGARFQGHLVRAKKKKEEMVLSLKTQRLPAFEKSVWSSETKFRCGWWEFEALQALDAM